VVPAASVAATVRLVAEVLTETTHPAHVEALGSAGRAACVVATVTQYWFAPDTVFQLNVGVRAIPVAPSAGLVSTGAVSEVGASVKETETDFGLPIAPAAESEIVPV
jgi:hypothetical protein